MALVDYRGFRLIAISILPISKSTLIYGSNDGGNRIFAEDEEFNSFMKKAGDLLNVKPHFAGLNPNERKFIYSAADIEGHFGFVCFFLLLLLFLIYLIYFLFIIYYIILLLLIIIIIIIIIDKLFFVIIISGKK